MQMAEKIRTLLVFDGNAEQAMLFYIGLFSSSKVNHIIHYEEGDNQGKIQEATFTLSGREFIAIGTPVKYNFSFTPAVSIYVDCDSMEELARVYSTLADGGKALMPLDN
jgi:predicted 3-demethylubiquinone-9 3-methyltransferase (glyoxalase superfamily)